MDFSLGEWVTQKYIVFYKHCDKNEYAMLKHTIEKFYLFNGFSLYNPQHLYNLFIL